MGNTKLLQILFSWGPKSLQTVTKAMKLKDDCFLKAMTNLDSVLKSRDIILLKKVHIVKAFSVVTYGWIVKQAECQRIETFKQWSWRSLLKVPWIARRSNQSILREINPE